MKIPFSVARIWVGRAALMLATLPLSGSAGLAAVTTPELPLLLFGDESAAATDGAAGFLFNPAAVGLRYDSELLLSWSDLEPDRTLYRALWSSGGFGLGFSRWKDVEQRVDLGIAGGEDGMRLGWAGAYRISEISGDRVLDHRFGILSRPAPWFSLGATVDHAGQPRFESVRLRREYTLGLGVRPLALAREIAHTWGTRLTLTGDVLLKEGADRDQARVRVGGQLELVPGLVLRGAIEDHGSFHLGLGILGTRTAYHGQAAYDQDGGRRYATHSVSLHRGEDRSVLAGRVERRVAVVRIGGLLGDDALGGPSLLGPPGTVPVRTLHRQLERALEDPLTRGVLLDLRGASNMAQLEELRPRVARLRAAGKPVVAFLEHGGGRGDLYLASACDRVVTTEEAFFFGLGLRVERRYYRQLLADWGLRVDRTAVGPYKSAYRNFSADSTPPQDREAIERQLDVSQELFVSTVAADRKMERDLLLPLLDGRPWMARDLATSGLVDSVGYREDALRLLGRLAGLSDRPRTVNLARTPQARRVWTEPERIAVVYASGDIETGRSGNDVLLGPTMGSETLVQQIESAFKRRGVEAVVLRVESPGGSALASNLIHHATERMKRETGKPLIVSMGSVAASGGYYISAHGDRIFADRFTRTGSIGVVSIKPSLEGWYAKHGVRQEDFERGRFMRGWSIHRDWNAELQAIADSATNDFYRLFVAKVADGRKLSWEQVDSVAQGRVWMGEDARERKLVDEIGGFEAALAEARRRAGVPERERIRLVEYRRPMPGFLQRVIGSTVRGLVEGSFRLPDPGAVYYWSDVEEAP